MDLKEVPTTALLGDIIGFFAPMNGGKTEGEVLELRRAFYYDLNTVAYNHVRNIREKNAIVVDDKYSHPAVTVASIPQLREDFLQRRAELEKYLGTSRGEPITIEGITHYKGYPLKVVGIDEVNLFSLTEQEAADTLDFLHWCKQEKIAVFLSGLLYDFRHFPFGHVHAILPYIDIKQEKKPACMALDGQGIKCTNTAKHTQRVWSREFVKEQELENLIEGLGTFGFVHKDKQRFPEEYVAAPFFDKTVRIEEAEQRKVMYLPVCTGCARLPFKEETFGIFQGIIETNTAPGSDDLLSKSITQFLLSEGWVRQEGERLEALHYYKNKLGGFSPGR